LTVDKASELEPTQRRRYSSQTAAVAVEADARPYGVGKNH
jgi:hypothetical protein